VCVCVCVCRHHLAVVVVVFRHRRPAGVVVIQTLARSLGGDWQHSHAATLSTPHPSPRARTQPSLPTERQVNSNSSSTLGASKAAKKKKKDRRPLRLGGGGPTLKERAMRTSCRLHRHAKIFRCASDRRGDDGWWFCVDEREASPAFPLPAPACRGRAFGRLFFARLPPLHHDRYRRRRFFVLAGMTKRLRSEGVGVGRRCTLRLGEFLFLPNLSCAWDAWTHWVLPLPTLAVMQPKDQANCDSVRLISPAICRKNCVVWLRLHRACTVALKIQVNQKKSLLFEG
jgi:hypothetical protein